MRITKFGHSCMLVEEGEARILFDPGIFSKAQNEISGIDAVLITHEHPDHVDMASLKAVLEKNPDAKVITNTAVAALLTKEGISSEVVEDGQRAEVKGVSIEGVGNEHGRIHSTITPPQNTGYIVGGTFYYPGDSVTLPKGKIKILALPVAGPWMKMEEALDFALAVKPEHAFPVHDAILTMPQIALRWPPQVLEPAGIKFTIIKDGESAEF